MELDLSKVTFSNGIFNFELIDYTLIMYNVNESMTFGSAEVPVKRIVLMLEDADGNQTQLSSVIGFSFKGYKLTTGTKELEGQLLTEDNISYCKLEIPEDE